MNTQLAFLICVAGIAGLFFLDRNKSIRTSPALWLPVIYLLIVGSRPVSMWLGGGGDVPLSNALAATLDGSPEDAVVSGMLILGGILVLLLRRRRAGVILKASLPIIVYYGYCLLSTMWSPYPEPSFKRWIKCVGDLVMVLIVVTDAQPTAALGRIYSRVAFVLFPLSLVLIKSTNLGVTYDEYGPSFVGVTTNKNTFGMMLFIFSTGVVWNIRSLVLDRRAINRRSRLVAQTALLGFGIVLLQMAHSATSIFCFILGDALMLATGLPIVRKRPSMAHTLCLGVLVLGVGSLLFGGASAVTSAMGKTSDFSGRTEIWAAAIASADSPWFGTGFESFWNKNNPKVVRILVHGGYGDISNLNSAHNGYLQIYLDLGWVGVCLLAYILCSGYLRAVKAFRRNRELGSLFLTYIVTCAFYSITEAGFRIMTLSWIFLLLAVVGSTCVIAGVTKVQENHGRVPRVPGSVMKLRVKRHSRTVEVFDSVAPSPAFAYGADSPISTSLD